MNDTEVMGLLREQGIVPVEEGELQFLRLEDAGEGVVRMHLASPDTSADPAEGAQVIPVTVEGLPDVVEGLIHKLHLSQVILVPVGKWRHLFDAVAFSLADNEDWQAVDTAATVELNTRDPILCEPGDFHTVAALTRALLADGESPEQGITLTSTAAPLLVEVIPDGAIRLTFGNQVLADEAAEALQC